MGTLQWKWTGLGIVVLASLLLLYPSFHWYGLPAQERQRLESTRQKPKHLLNLGLDLKGGTHLLMELDASKLDPKEDLSDALSRAIQIIGNRINQFGVSEPMIAKQGERWIVVQLPGLTNPDQAKDLIGKTALLEFKLVEDSPAAQKLLEKASSLNDPAFNEKGELHPELAKLVPQGTQLLPGKEDRFYVVKAGAELTGAYLKNARVETGGDFGFPVVGIQFNPEGAKLFDQATGANVGKNLAIVLDGIVHSAPVIRSRISGGNGQIEGNFSMEEARNLAIVLRAGALPAPVRIIEERTVGPSLGEDSIKAGIRACAVGGLLVVVFMVTYYRFAGLVANTALVLNLLFLMACMSYFGATLTLPGIAGIVLTFASAIDANVLIYERIREELRLAKPVRIALETGYEKAFSAIFDSNLTTFITGVFLFQFGSGPIKGFALTLTMGIAISMFTAVVVTRIFFDSYLKYSNTQRLSI